MCGVDAHLTWQRVEQAAQGVVLLARQRERPGIAEQVGAARVAREQTAAAKERRRLVPILPVQGIAEVVWRMSRRLYDAETQRADLDVVAFAYRAMCVVKRVSGAGDDGRAGLRHQLARACDVIVVDVRLQNVRDPHARAGRSFHIDIHVAARINNGCAAALFIDDEVGLMSQSLKENLFDVHLVSCENVEEPFFQAV
jgi:hypothetical protein